MRGDEIDNDLTVFLARRALSVDPASLPEDILIIARHCLLDWFTLALTSWHTPAVSQLEQFLGESGMQRGPATLLGSGIQTSVDTAAMLNGPAGHVLDFDDEHRSEEHRGGKACVSTCVSRWTQNHTK